MSDTTNRKPTVRAALLFEGLIVPVAAVGIVVLGIDVHTLGLPVWRALVSGAAGSIATFALLFCLTRFEHLSRAVFKQHAKDLYTFASSFSLAGIISLAVLAGIGEELLFRGLIQGWVSEKANNIWGVTVAAVLFGLVHFLSPAYFVIATGMGAALGAAYVLSESILLVIVWHGAYDLIALIVLTRFPHLLGIEGGNT